MVKPVVPTDPIEPRQTPIDPTPEDFSRLAAALRVMAASELAQAGRVQGPSFGGTEWGADIIDGHITRAAVLRDAADALVWARREQIAAISRTCGDA